MTTKTPAQILSATLAEILASWDESLYERDERGQFAPKGGGDSGGEQLTPEQNREKWRQQDEEPDEEDDVQMQRWGAKELNRQKAVRQARESRERGMLVVEKDGTLHDTKTGKRGRADDFSIDHAKPGGKNLDEIDRRDMTPPKNYGGPIGDSDRYGAFDKNRSPDGAKDTIEGIEPSAPRKSGVRTGVPKGSNLPKGRNRFKASSDTLADMLVGRKP